MSTKIKTALGTIIIDNEVVAMIAGLAAMDCYGIVGMASTNVKDGIVQLLRRENLTKGIRLSSENNRLVVEMHIIVEYGTNIRAIGETLVDTVKYRLKELVDIPVEKIVVFVDGIRIEK